MSTGIMNCQRCGSGNKYTRWVKDKFVDYPTLICQNCGFIIYDEEKSYQVRKNEYENKKSDKRRCRFDRG
ncbi:hypothetical protein KAU51_04090 [Candidatus Parcubacteria bacterium]|nr:hypothetical protein [Candidatus Parcubacteria bacterium]